MFDYPKQAEFGRPLPKTKIYEFASVSSGVRKRFVSQVDSISWKYKLSPETINLPARGWIHEIQVFEISLKGNDLDEDVLRAIDKAIAMPIFYRLIRHNKVKTVAGFKRPSDADSSKCVIETYLEGEWQSPSAARPALPLALDLLGLYEEMLRRHMRVPTRTGESLKSYAERQSKIRANQSNCRDLEIRIRREKQFNRKVELNSQLNCLKAELEKLSASQENSTP